ncbi:MAG: double zinc ribbon domain-containing protein [Halolamina sp.]
MSKITFRADDELVERLDELDASKSEVMREALREFLDRHHPAGAEREVTATDDAEVTVGGRETPALTVNINLGDDAGQADTDQGADRQIPSVDDDQSCKQCGEGLDPDHAFCPNCGQEHHRRPRCECGEAVRPEWAFCPGCGRRSSSADVFDQA